MLPMFTGNISQLFVPSGPGKPTIMYQFHVIICDYIAIASYIV